MVKSAIPGVEAKPDYDTMKKRIRSGSGEDNAASFAGWVQRTQQARKALLEKKRQHDEELSSMKDIYASRLIEEKKAEFERDELQLASVARKKVTEDLESVIAAKTKQYDRAMGAPSESQLRLLNVMKMRQEIGEDLTSKDFAGAVGSCADNYHCLRLLQNLAKKAKVEFPMIHDDFREDLETVRRAASNILYSLDKPEEDLGYLERLFWTNGNIGLNQNVFDKLDELKYLSVSPEDVEKARLEKAAEEDRTEQSGTSDNKYCSKIRLTGTENIDAIADQFHVTKQEIAALNPSVNLKGIYAGLEIYVPSTHFSFSPGNPSRVQNSQVQLAETPHFPDPIGPNGEEVGDDIAL